ncbi:hypothetical protein AAHC03_05627 [Spirometra sp. Aus1]
MERMPEENPFRDKSTRRNVYGDSFDFIDALLGQPSACILADANPSGPFNADSAHWRERALEREKTSKVKKSDSQVEVEQTVRAKAPPETKRSA